MICYDPPRRSVLFFSQCDPKRSMKSTAPQTLSFMSAHSLSILFFRNNFRWNREYSEARPAWSLSASLL
jgi:hypothetical protein